MSSFTRIDSEMLILNASLDIIVKRLRDGHKKVILQLCAAKLTFIGGQVTIPVKFRSVQPFGLLRTEKNGQTISTSTSHTSGYCCCCCRNKDPAFGERNGAWNERRQIVVGTNACQNYILRYNDNVFQIMQSQIQLFLFLGLNKEVLFNTGLHDGKVYTTLHSSLHHDQICQNPKH